MVSYTDYTKYLLDWNFTGNEAPEGQVQGQTVTMNGDNHVITYSFFKSYSDITSSDYYAANTEEAQEFIDGTEYQQNIEDTLKIIYSQISNDPRYVWFQNVANIEFLETPVGTNDLDGSGSIDNVDEYTTGHIAIGQLDSTYSNFSSNTASAITIQYNPNEFPEHAELKHGDIFFNSQNSYWNNSLDLGTQQFKVLLEETLQSLGVDSKDVAAEGTYLDNQKYTVTAYTADNAPGMYDILTNTTVAPHTLQIMDIAALQAIYGRNYTTLTDDTDYTLSVMNPRYSLSPDKAFLYTIWDGGGNDTIDVSDSGVSAEIDLRQGRFSSIGNKANILSGEIDKDIDATTNDPDPGNVAIAYHAVIENAIGTNQNDTLIGNAWDNRLEGGAGDDVIYGDGIVYDGNEGYGANDGNHESASGIAASTNGSGDDILIGGAGDDVIYGGAGHDLVDGGEGFDTLDLSNINIAGFLDLDYGVAVTARNSSETHYLFEADDESVSNTFKDIESIILSDADNKITLLEELIDTQYDINANGGFDTLRTTNYNGLVLTDSGIYTGSDSFIENVEKIEIGHSSHYYSGLNGFDGRDDIYISSLNYEIDAGGEEWGLDYQGMTEALTFNLSGKSGNVSNGIVTQSFTDSIKSIAGTHLGDVITLNDSINFYSGLGDDHITQINNNANLFYSGGDDHLYGGSIILGPDITFEDISINLVSSQINYNEYENISGGIGDFYVTIQGVGSVTLHNYSYTVGANKDFLKLFDGNKISISVDSNALSVNAISTVSSSAEWENARTPLNDSIVSSADSIHGKNGDDYIWGVGTDSQTLRGGLGNDQLIVYQNENLLYGHLGNDYLWGGAGEDYLFGGLGDDQLAGGDSDDYLYAGEGDDKLYGQNGEDILFGGEGDDSLYGNDGNDKLDGGAGVDYLSGGEGNDRYYYTQGEKTISETYGANGDYDVIYLSHGITASDVTLSRNSNDDLILDIANRGTIKVLNEYDDSTFNKIESLVILSSDELDSPSIGLESYFYGNQYVYTSAEGGIFNGTENRDRIIGRDGADIIYTYASNNLYYSDTVLAGRGDDLIYGGIDGDKFYGEFGNDILYGFGGNDFLFGGDGNDVLFGDEGDDLLKGGAGDDVFHPGIGNDSIEGGTGNDLVDYSSDIASVDVNLGSRTAIDGSGNNEFIQSIEDIVGSDFNDTLRGSIYSNYIFGGLGVDSLFGDDGDDILYSGDGVGIDHPEPPPAIQYPWRVDDSLFGGNGNDTLYAGDIDLSNSPAGYDADIFYLNGGEGDDILHSGSGGAKLEGGKGHDIAYGNGASANYIYNLGDDTFTIDQGAGDRGKITFHGVSFANLSFETSSQNATLTAGTVRIIVNGDNTQYLDLLNALVDDGQGNIDTFVPYLEFESGFYELIHINDPYYGTGQSTVGDFDVIEVVYSPTPDQKVATEANDVIAGVSSINALGGHDVIKGTDNDDSNNGGTGNDYLYGFSGNDVLYGGAGDDTLYGGIGDDDLRGQDGIDTIYAGEGDDFILGGAGDTIYGEAGNDVMRGYGGTGVFDGGEGTDKAWWRDYQHAGSVGLNINLTEGTATDGDNLIATISNVEDVIGSVYSDTLIGDVNANVIRGGSDRFGLLDGNDTLHGKGGADTLYGDKGDDVLIGGDGFDKLFGNAGADTFVFEAANAYNDRDDIRDFSLADGDKIDLSDLLAGYDPLNDLITDFVQITDNGTHSYVAVDADGGADSFLQVAQVVSVTGLTDESTLEANGTLIV